MGWEARSIPATHNARNAIGPTARPIICMISRSEYSCRPLFWKTLTPLRITVWAAMGWRPADRLVNMHVTRYDLGACAYEG